MTVLPQSHRTVVHMALLSRRLLSPLPRQVTPVEGRTTERTTANTRRDAGGTTVVRSLMLCVDGTATAYNQAVKIATVNRSLNAGGSVPNISRRLYQLKPHTHPVRLPF